MVWVRLCYSLGIALSGGFTIDDGCYLFVDFLTGLVECCAYRIVLC